jgi:hypothetical protein
MLSPNVSFKGKCTRLTEAKRPPTSRAAGNPRKLCDMQMAMNGHLCSSVDEGIL